jgi:hypothetical protein
MTEPLQQASNSLSPLLKVFELDSSLLSWYERQDKINAIINEALRQYQHQYSLLEKEGWKYQIKALYQLHVIAKDNTEYVCDLTFKEFKEAEVFLKDFLVYESGGDWITSNQMAFTPVSEFD